MTSAKHERARAVERFSDCEEAAAVRGQWQSEEQDREHREQSPAEPRAIAQVQAGVGDRLHATAQGKAGRSSRCNDRELDPRVTSNERRHRGERGDRRTLLVGTELLRHAEYSLCDNGERDDLQAVDRCVADRAGDARQQRGEGEQQQR